MGRNRVRLKINSDRLREAIGDKCTWSEIAEKYGVTRQAVNNWLADGLIPPRALIEIVRDLALESGVVDEILEGGLKTAETPRKILINVEIIL